jgi:hypothetical protein
MESIKNLKIEKMKICKNCESEFTPIHATRGSEQLYCSRKCAQQMAKKRREEKMYQQAKSEVKNEVKKNEISEANENNRNDKICGMAQQRMENIVTDRWVSANDPLAMVEKIYEVRNENQFLKFKIENLEKEIAELNSEIYELEAELESEEPDEGNFMGGIMEQFKKDPITTITFAKTFFNQYLNNTDNAKASTS